MNLNLRYFFFVLILFQGLSLSAEKKPENYIDRLFFIQSVSDVFLQDKPDMLAVKAAPFLKDKETDGIPDCFPCSLYLIRATFSANADTQLVAADLAVKFSPDLPEAHIHYLSRLLKFTPFSFDRISKELCASAISFFNFPSRDAFFYSILNGLIKGCVIFLMFFIIILFFKYFRMAHHKYMHLTGHSGFYALVLLPAIGVSGWIMIHDPLNYTLALLVLIMFFSSFSLIREKIILYALFLIIIAAQSGIILTGANEEASIDTLTAVNHLNAVYSPVSAQMKQIDPDLPGGSMAKGYMFYYKGNYKRAVFHFKKELSTISEGEIKASLENAIGLSYAAMGDYKEAIQSLKNSFNSSRKTGTGYNLSKVLYEGGMTEEGSSLERSILERAEGNTLTYAGLDLPPMHKIWRFMTSGKTNTRFENFVRFFIFILGNLFFFILLTLIRINYLKNLKLTRCYECGSVICSKCNGGAGEQVCAVCKLMKAAPDVFKEGEKAVYENKREKYFAKESISGMIMNFLIPGGGLIYYNRVLEGFFYLFTTITVFIQLTQNEMGLMYLNTGSSETIKIIAIIIATILYLVSIIRGYVVSRGDN
ncbi:MAG TPA: tetratricopeptide repeat protein [bacterium]|nr:tetratricopeptide repeat protein [bacterium]HPS30587.1 tetratricopeptide repeat protein [bacterium]